MKKIKLLTILLALSSIAFAQTPFSLMGGSTVTNFDGGSLDNGTSTTLNTFPAGWGLAEQGTGNSANGFYRAGTGASNVGDARSFGAFSSQERAFGGIASGSVQAWLGFAFTNNTGNTITSMSVSYTGEQWRAGDTNPLVDSLLFEYSLNATSTGDTSATWIAVSALNFLSPNPTGTINAGSLDGNLAGNQSALSSTITATVANSNTVHLRWRDIDLAGSDDGLAVDNFTMTVTTSGGPLPPALLSTSPPDNATNVPLSTTALTLTLDQNITSIGAGNVQLIDITNSNTMNIPAANVTFSGAVLTISGVTLSSNTDYAVQITPNMLVTANGNYAGIVNNTTWNFKTVNTSPPPAVTSLNETFTACNDPMFGVFTSFTEVGNEIWRCSFFGNGDTNAVHMNGFSGGNKDNIDWLISPTLDLSAMLNPHLNFWSKIRFPDTNPKELLISTNYSGLGDPTLASWTSVQINNWASLDTNWKQFTNVDLSQYKANNFHIAFRYTSDTASADDWYLDDIEVIEAPSSVSNFSSKNLSMKVLGDVYGTLNLQSASAKARNLNYSILDMAGRVIQSGDMTIQKGKQQHALNIFGLHGGMYFLNINNGQAKTIVKFIVK